MTLGAGGVATCFFDLTFGLSMIAGAVLAIQTKGETMTHHQRVERIGHRAKQKTRRMAIMSRLSEAQLSRYPRLDLKKRIWWQIQKMWRK
jgi:hypothetical protein